MARFYCDIDGFRDNWIEVSDAWTRREQRDLLSSVDVTHVFGWFQRKVEACHIVLPNGTALTDPKTITDESFDDADVRLWGFVAGVVHRQVENLRSLGNFSGRLSLPTNGAAPTKVQA